MNRQETSGPMGKNELSAIEAYQGMLGAKEWTLGDGDPEIDELFHILVDHVQAASLLRRRFGRLKRMPSVSELKPQAKWSEFGTLAGGLFRRADPTRHSYLTTREADMRTNEWVKSWHSFQPWGL